MIANICSFILIHHGTIASQAGAAEPVSCDATWHDEPMSTVYDFTGKVALVTGGAGGIGSATVRRILAGGGKVAIVDRDGDKARNLAVSLGASALAIEVDVSDEASVDQAITTTVARFGHVDLHVLNAGIPGSMAPFEQLTADDFDHVIAVNLRSVFLGLRAAFRQYEAQATGGAIVVMGSICSLGGSSDMVPYHAAKHGVIGLARSAAVHGGERGVRVNAVAPGVIVTDLVAGTPEGLADAQARARIAPMRRTGTTDEVAGVIAFLLSDDASFVTGETVSIDGGATAMNPVRWSGQGGRPATA
jgi:NAD(P)-dependent dehydrogenase (short-subunit alcohol dehydrogenase family)